MTSHGVGMAVPDWPNTFGYNMFAFPISHWIGGIFYEHSHRLIATFVGLATAVLACLLWSRETEGNHRSAGIIGIIIVLMLLGWRIFPVYVTLASLVPIVVGFSFWKFIRSPQEYRWLGIAAFAAVILQGVLGGLRVVLYKDEIGIFHGMLAQTFFCGVTLLAVITSRSFKEKRWAAYEPHQNIRYWVLGATLLIFVQLGVAATMRHEHIGLSIPDFPLAYGQVLPDTSAEAMTRINAERAEMTPAQPPTTAMQVWMQMVHRFIAVLIFTAVAIIFAKSRRTSRGSQKFATLWLGMICVQICLGAWTIWSNKAADVATLHMALGALSLVLGAVFTLWLFRGARTQDFAWPDAPKRPMMGVA